MWQDPGRVPRLGLSQALRSDVGGEGTAKANVAHRRRAEEVVGQARGSVGPRDRAQAFSRTGPPAAIPAPTFPPPPVISSPVRDTRTSPSIARTLVFPAPTRRAPGPMMERERSIKTSPTYSPGARAKVHPSGADATASARLSPGFNARVFKVHLQSRAAWRYTSRAKALFIKTTTYDTGCGTCHTTV